MATKFWRTVVTVEVLTSGDEPPAGWDDLAALHEDITTGHASGVWDHTSEEVPRERMAELLKAQGSDPEFLLDDDDEEGR